MRLAALAHLRFGRGVGAGAVDSGAGAVGVGVGVGVARRRGRRRLVHSNSGRPVAENDVPLVHGVGAGTNSYPESCAGTSRTNECIYPELLVLIADVFRCP